MNRRVLAGIGRGALLVAGGLVIALALLTLGARVALPFAAGWKGELEAGLGDFLGRPVAIESLALRWRGTGPELRAQGVSVAEDERRRISVDEALIDLDLASSVLRRSFVFDELTLVGARLVLERDAASGWSVQAVDVAERGPREAGSAPAPGKGFDGLRWLFDARRVGLLDTSVTLTDAATGPLLELDSVDLRVESDDGTHRMRLTANLPPALGGDIELGIDLVSGMRGVVESRASGNFYARAERLEGVALAQALTALSSGATAGAGAVPARPASPLDGRLAAEIWGTLKAGRLDTARGRVELRDVRVAGDPEAPVAIDLVDATLRFARTTAGERADGPDEPDGPDGWTLVVDGADVAGSGAVATLDVLRLGRAAPGAPLVLEAGGRDLPIRLAAALPLGLVEGPVEGSADGLGELAPRGSVDRWSSAVRLGEGARGVDLDARVTGVTTSATGPLPGVDALDASIVLRGGKGRLTLSAAGADGLVVRAPRIDADPLVVDALEARLDIDLRDTVSVRGPVALKSGGLELSTRLGLVLEPGRSPLLDLDGRFSMDDVRGVAGLLPDRLLGRETFAWFDRALRAGRATDGELRLSGRLADFPFTGGASADAPPGDDPTAATAATGGTFRVGLDIEGVELDWQPGWPVATGLAGSIRIDGAAVAGEVRAGRGGALALRGASWTIDDLASPRFELELSGTAGLSGLLDFANRGPLAATLEPALGDVSGTGRAEIDVAVSAPLSRAAALRGGPLGVDGTLFLSGNDVSFGRAQVDLDDVVGAIGFDIEGFRTHRLKARWLGRPLVVDADTVGEGATREARVGVRGAFEAADVLTHYALPLDGFVSGASLWHAELVAPFDAGVMARRGVTLAATSELVGTALRLPAPLGKPSSGARAFRVDTAFRPDSDAARWTVRAGDGLVARADVDADGLRALALGLGGADASGTGTSGVRIDGRVDVLSLDGWAESLGELIDALPVEAGPPEPMLPVSGALAIGELTLFDAPLGAGRLRLNSDADYLNVALDNAALNGNARWPRLEGGGLPAKIRLARVDGAVVDAVLRPADAADGAAGEAPPEGPDPRELPAIEAHVASLGWRAATLDNLVLRTSPDIAGLRIDTLGFTHDDLQLLGEGYWRVADPQGTGGDVPGLQRTALSLTLQSPDFGAGLANLGLPGLLARGAGRATARIGWPGPAWAPALETLGGALQFDLEDGAVVPLDPGAGKLLGLFAFQALPRRLDFDFSDVVDEGLAFSRLSGRAGIEDGVVDASLVQLTGPVGVVDVSGTTDLVGETLDQRITVLPRVSAALPIIGVIAGGASAGVGALLAGGVLKALGVDLDRLGLREYTLTGTWDAPAFEPR